MSLKVSIIVPVYNIALKLPKGLESLAKQTYNNIEILLINDGSKDDSLAVCKSFAQKDKRFIVFDKENSGAGETRNLGLDHATGEFVMFMDADDWYEKDMIEKMMSWICSQDDMDSVCCARYNERQQGDGTYVTSSESPMDLPTDNYVINDIAEYIARLEESRRFPYLWDKIYRRDIIEKCHIRFEKQFVTGQDNDFNIKYFRYIRKAMISNECLYHYVKDGVGSLCARYKKDLYKIVSELNRRKYALFNEYGMFENKEYLRIYANSYIAYLHTCIPNMFRDNAKLSIYEKNKLMKELLLDLNIKEYLPLYKAQTRIEIIFRFILKAKCPLFSVLIYSCLFFIRNNYEKIYNYIR